MTTDSESEQIVTEVTEKTTNGDIPQYDYNTNPGDNTNKVSNMPNERSNSSTAMCPTKTITSTLNTCIQTLPKTSEVYSYQFSSPKVGTKIPTTSILTGHLYHSTVSTSITKTCWPCTGIEASTKYTTVVVYSTYYYANNPAKEEERMQYCSGTDSLLPALGGVIALLIVLLAVAISGYIYIYWHLKKREKFSARSRQAA